jgi:uncharacterized membrane protein YdjX (TVP38/TMEM64 family)
LTPEVRTTSRLATWKRPLGLLLLLLALLLVGRVAPVGTWLVAGSTQLRQAGLLGALLFVLAYTPGALLFVPAAMFTFVAGFAFGPWWGALVGIPGIGSSSMVVFLLARGLLRGQVERWLAHDKRFVVVDHLLAKLGPRAVVLLRLSPISPFSILNYAFGLTAIPKSQYFFATCLGTLPGSLFFAQLGAAAPSLAVIAEGRLPDAGRAQTYLLLFGLVVTASVGLWLGRVAKHALGQAQRPATDPPRA